jgi:hypothetical protein
MLENTVAGLHTYVMEKALHTNYTFDPRECMSANKIKKDISSDITFLIYGLRIIKYILFMFN